MLFSLDENTSLFPIPLYFPFLQVNSNMNQYETLSCEKQTDRGKRV